MRWAKIGFICVFVALMLLPALQAAFPLIDITPLDERRQLAPAPDVAGALLRGDGRLARSVNSWFDDRVGFRPLLVRLSNQLDYSLFRHSNRVVIGKDGWLYDPGFLALRVDAERQGEALGRALREKFLAIARYLAKRDIRLVVVSNPTKETVYPQFLPASAPRLPEFSEFDKFSLFLRRHREWIYLDGGDVLARCRNGHDLFTRTDHHLMPTAALCFPEELVGRIAIAEGRKASPWNEKFDSVDHPWGGGGLARFLAVFDPPTEIAYDPRGLFNSVPPPQGRFEKAPSPPFEEIYHTDPAHRADKFPQLVLFGNSFVDYYLPGGLINYFTDVYRIRGRSEDLSVALRNIPPGTRYFVLQFLEVWLAGFVTSDVPAN
jgi:hypothetical protein